MCIIAGSVEFVKATKIFVAPSTPNGGANGGGEGRQLVVYSNSVSTKVSNMMILPVPFPETLKFEKDVMTYKELFEDSRNSLFLYQPNQDGGAWSTRSVPTLSAKAYLPVFDVGSYQVSVAMSFEDLYKVNPVIFAQDPELYRMLQGTYPSRVGYLCCRLKPGENQYEPIAYSHMRDERNRLFIPTKHYHISTSESSADKYADWDHEIYSVGTAVSAHRNDGDIYIPKGQNNLNWEMFLEEFRWGAAQKIHRWACSGEYPNIDLGLSIA